MAYRVFISTTLDQETHTFITGAKQSLWQLKDFPIAPMTMEDLMLAGHNPEALIRQTLDETDVFIGIYGHSYGEYKNLKVADLLEYEYMYAMERGISALIFMPADATRTEDRLLQFKKMIKSRQVVNTYTSQKDLNAKLVVAVMNFRKTSRKRPQIEPPKLGIIPPQQQTQATDEQFEDEVRRAFDLVEDDIENIVSRALAMQQAQGNLVPSTVTGGAGHELTVNPIFGEPNKNIQFHSDVFMIMPFREEYDAVYQNVILPAIDDMNLTIKRGDEFNSVSGQIMSEVWAAINACRLVIVETSQENANVYYELGIAHTLGKPAILITQGKDIEDFPFDIRHLRFIVYENTIAGGEKLEEDLKQSIIWILNDLEDGI
jgi:hypothetical protein